MNLAITVERHDSSSSNMLYVHVAESHAREWPERIDPNKPWKKPRRLRTRRGVFETFSLRINSALPKARAETPKPTVGQVLLLRRYHGARLDFAPKKIN